MEKDTNNIINSRELEETEEKNKKREKKEAEEKPSKLRTMIYKAAKLPSQHLKERFFQALQNKIEKKDYIDKEDIDFTDYLNNVETEYLQEKMINDLDTVDMIIQQVLQMFITMLNTEYESLEEHNNTLKALSINDNEQKFDSLVDHIKYESYKSNTNKTTASAPQQLKILNAVLELVEEQMEKNHTILNIILPDKLNVFSKLLSTIKNISGKIAVVAKRLEQEEMILFEHELSTLNEFNTQSSNIRLSTNVLKNIPEIVISRTLDRFTSLNKILESKFDDELTEKQNLINIIKSKEGDDLSKIEKMHSHIANLTRWHSKNNLIITKEFSQFILVLNTLSIQYTNMLVKSEIQFCYLEIIKLVLDLAKQVHMIISSMKRR